MTSSELRDQVLLFTADSLIEFVDINNNEIRVLFLQAPSSVDAAQAFEQILLKISQLQLSQRQKDTVQIQSLVTHLALFFKRMSRRPSVETCNNILSSSVFKRRIEAWLYQKRYHNFQSHVSLFKKYLKKLSDARYDGEDDYIFELMDDLLEYQKATYEIPSVDIRNALKALFQDKTLQSDFPLLKEFDSPESIYVPSLQTENYDAKEYEPSVFAEQIFDSNFMTYIRTHSPDFPNILLGHQSLTIREQIIKQGQANFDKPFGKLTPEQIIKLYCYFNMRMHFYSSLSLFERSDVINQHYTSNGKIKFIDIGCGPATSGIAFVEHIYNETNTTAIFDYYGVDSSQKMQVQAKAVMTNGVFSQDNINEYCKDVLDIDIDKLYDNSCIIVNTCYLFASPTLPIGDIVQFITNLKEKYPFRPKYLLFQNPDADFLNQKYNTFKEQIGDYEVDFSKPETIFYHNRRNSFYEAKKIRVFFEILKF